MVKPRPMIYLGYENVRVPKPISILVTVKLDSPTYAILSKLAAEENSWVSDKAEELIRSCLGDPE